MNKLAFVSLLFFCGCAQQDNSLRLQVSQIAQAAQGTVGVSIENLESGDTLSLNGNYHCPMQSVFKFPINMDILNMVDNGTLSLEQKVHLSQSDFADTATWSPIRDKYHGKDTDVTIDELIQYMITQSDNTACEKLIEIAGGVHQVENYIHSIGVKGIAIAATEKQMHADNTLQYKSWCEPKEMTHLLKLFYEGKCLSKSSTAYLLKTMEGTATGTKRLKGLLPAGTVVAHKTGSSGTQNGFTPATNDVGIITLPNGNHLIVSVFVTDSKASDTTRDAVIARIAKAAYDKMGK
jgi:beta-lactamase class A